MLSPEFQSAINSIIHEYEKIQTNSSLTLAGYEARIRNDYAVKQALENGLKVGQDPVKAINAAIELLKPYTLHGKENNQS